MRKLLALALLLLAPVALSAGWPTWDGTDVAAVAADGKVPMTGDLKFAETIGLRWEDGAVANRIYYDTEHQVIRIVVGDHVLTFDKYGLLKAEAVHAGAQALQGTTADSYVFRGRAAADQLETDFCIEAPASDTPRHLMLSSFGSSDPPVATGGKIVTSGYLWISGTDYIKFMTRTSDYIERMRLSNDGYLGIGTDAPTSRLHLAAGSASVAPLGFTSGTLLTTTAAGKVEFLTDDYYATITTGAGAGIYTSNYPPAQSSTYVKATSEYAAGYKPYYTTDPAKSLTGDPSGNGWYSSTDTNQRFHIDLGSPKTVVRIYYENAHNTGDADSTGYGAKNFTFWGSNSAASFADTTYATDTGWTQLTTSQSTFDRHASSDAADPKTITVTNTTAYRYYAIKCADAWVGGVFLGLRRVELQDLPTARKRVALTDGPALTATRVPYATTNGRLKDSSDFTYTEATGALQVPQYRLSDLNTAPSSASDTGTKGEIRITADYLYVCVAANTWVRAALATW